MQGEIQNLINQRKENLNRISIPYLFQDFLDVINEGFLIYPLDSEDIKKAKTYNDETDEEVLKMFETL